jgi:hypothetical protein
VSTPLRWFDFILLALVAIAAAVFMLPTLILPLHPDQALFAVVARTVASGGFPYKDAWDFKLPGLYLLYAPAIQGPFDIAHNLRVFTLVWTAASTVLVAALGRRWWNWRAAMIAALLYVVVCSTDIPFWQSAQPDSLAVLPLLLSLLLYEVARGRRLVLILAGLALGVAFQLRATTALLAVLFPLVELFRVEAGRFRLWLSRLLWLAAGFAILQATIIGYLVVGGAFGEFVATMRYAAGYTRTGGPWNPSTGPSPAAYWGALRGAFWDWSNSRLLLVYPALAAGVIGAAVIRERRVLQQLLFVLVCYLGVAVQLKFFWYHYGYMVPFLALLGGWGWDALLAAIALRRGALVALVAAGAVAGVLLLGSTALWDGGLSSWRSYLAYYRHRAEWQQTSPTISGLRDEQQVAGYVRDRSRPGDSMYVWGFDPVLYLLADRSLGSRFVLSYPLMSSWSPPRWQAEFVDELQAKRPTYIVLHPDEPQSWIVGEDLNAIDYINRFPEFQKLLATDYNRETVIAGRVLYRRRTP